MTTITFTATVDLDLFELFDDDTLADLGYTLCFEKDFSSYDTIFSFPSDIYDDIFYAVEEHVDGEDKHKDYKNKILVRYVNGVVADMPSYSYCFDVLLERHPELTEEDLEQALLNENNTDIRYEITQLYVELAKKAIAKKNNVSQIVDI